MFSETMLEVVNTVYGHRLRAEEYATQPLVGGILQHGYQCGMVWGVATAAGAEAETRAIHASVCSTDTFRKLHDTID